MKAILVLNVGSSSVKFALYEFAGELLMRGQIKSFPNSPVLHLRVPENIHEPLAGLETITDAVGQVVKICLQKIEGIEIKAIGHRVVHGAARFTGPVLIDPRTLADMAALSPLAPSHQPGNLEAIAAAEEHCPDAIQTASFDTSFHRTNESHVQLYALPRAILEKGIRRYGFHGLAYAYSADAMAERLPQIGELRIVAAHLGSGASLCAIKGRMSVATSMGFTALDGLPMSTRCGDIDPGVLLYLLQHEGMSAKELGDVLYKDSGLKGLSAQTGDMAALLGMEDDPLVAEALNYYCHRVRLGIGEMAAALGGIDALVFSGGVGEHAASIRRRIVEGLGWMGLAVDDDRNQENAELISPSGNMAGVHIVKADEEEIIRRDTVALLNDVE